MIATPCRRRTRKQSSCAAFLCLSLTAQPASGFVARKASNPIRQREQLDPTTRLVQQHLSRSHFRSRSHQTAPRWRVSPFQTRKVLFSTVPSVAVRIDQPLIPRTGLFPAQPPNTSVFPIKRWFLSILDFFSSSSTATTSSAAATASTATGTAGKIKLLGKVALWSLGGLILVSLLWSLVRVVAPSLMERVVQRVRNKSDTAEEILEPVGVPMPFDQSDNEGWGVCTLRSKRRLGKSSLVRYDFDLPRTEYILPLELGQQISLCCLDSNENVAKGDFYPYQPEPQIPTGSFSILAPNHPSPHDNELAVGRDTANFCRVLKQDMRVGDEIAIKPGSRKLHYKGQYLPVTDMVYVCFGVGVVPVLEQVRAVLPKGSSSVNVVTVVWINHNAKEFDVNAELLEKEYMKYKTKLAVLCIVEDLSITAMEDNVEISEAIPDFQPGTMVVLVGPEQYVENAVQFLEDRGFPSDCICVL